MSKVWEFLKYIWKCVAGGFSAVCGHVPEDLTWKDTIVGCITIIVVPLIIVLIYNMIMFIVSKSK